MTVSIAIRITILIAWLLSPVIIVMVAFLRRQKRDHDSLEHSRLRRAHALAIAANWILFVRLLIESQTPYGMDVQTSLLTHGLLVLASAGAVISISVRPRRWSCLLGNVILITLWVGVAYAPAHWLRKWDYGTVKIDGRPTPASIYIGNPTDSEAEAVVLVHVPATAADYFISFEDEKVRTASAREYVRMPGGIWTFRSMREMVFTDPLPSRQINEFRIASPKGDIVSVQF